MPEMIYNNNNDDDNEFATKENQGKEAKEKMKKGAWTLAEDEMLREYVKKYGEGNWNTVQKNCGLARCGKSCRLRWANHLRPNLIKGEFSELEEQIIIYLHAKFGNKWSRMAAKLHGRTDNEIKNFWNTRMKRCQRARLPLYPPEVLHNYHLQQYCEQPHPSSSFSFSSLLSPSYHHQLNNLISHSSAANPQQNHPHSYYYINPHPQFKFPNEKNGNGNIGLPLSPVSPYGSSSSSLFNQSFAATDSHDYHSGSYNYNYGFDNSVVMVDSPLESLPLVQGSNTEVSSQSPHESITSASSYASGVYGFMGASSNNIGNGYYEVAPLSPPHGNYSGLLDDLVVEAQNLCRNNKSKSEDSTTAAKLSNKRKSMVAEEHVEEKDTVLVKSSAMKNSGNITNKTQRVDSNSSQTGEKLVAEDTLAWMNPDDDLFSLLNNFPSEMPVPEWYHKGETHGLETQQDASLGPIDEEFAWALGTSWSNNMPNIL